MDITVLEVMLTPENMEAIKDFLWDYRKDVRFTVTQGCPSEEEFREKWKVGKWRGTLPKKGKRPVDERQTVIGLLRNMEKKVKGIKILPFGPFQAYELKGKYGNPDRPDIDGFAIVFTPEDKHTT